MKASPEILLEKLRKNFAISEHILQPTFNEANETLSDRVWRNELIKAGVSETLLRKGLPYEMLYKKLKPFFSSFSPKLICDKPWQIEVLAGNMEFLLQLENFDLKDNHGRHIVLYAALSGNPFAYLWIVQNNLDFLKICDGDLANFFHYAAASGNAWLLKCLSPWEESFANKFLFRNCDQNQYNFAHYAAQSGNIEVLDLIKQNDNSMLDALCEDKYLKLNIAHLAIIHDQIEVFDWILEHRNHLLKAGSMIILAISHGRLAVLDRIKYRMPELFNDADNQTIIINIEKPDLIDWFARNKPEILKIIDKKNHNFLHSALVSKNPDVFNAGIKFTKQQKFSFNFSHSYGDNKAMIDCMKNALPSNVYLTEITDLNEIYDKNTLTEISKILVRNQYISHITLIFTELMQILFHYRSAISLTSELCLKILGYMLHEAQLNPDLIKEIYTQVLNNSDPCKIPLTRALAYADNEKTRLQATKGFWYSIFGDKSLDSKLEHLNFFSSTLMDLRKEISDHSKVKLLTFFNGKETGQSLLQGYRKLAESREDRNFLETIENELRFS